VLARRLLAIGSKQTSQAKSVALLVPRKLERLDAARGQLHRFPFDQDDEASSSRSDAARTADKAEASLGAPAHV
jgi:hypothetical protein